MHSIDQIAGSIDEYMGAYSSLLLICDDLKVRLTSSPLFNFRDAIGHYLLLYNAQDKETQIAQETCITEHLHRGLRDGCYFILQKLKIGLHAELKNAPLSNPYRSRELRSLLHRCKSLELSMRKMVIISDPEITDCINKLNEVVTDMRVSFEKYDLDWDFCKYDKVKKVI